jgi:hypothetical protein
VGDAMRKEKQETKPQSRIGITFRNFKTHSDSLDDYFVDSEPSYRMEAESNGTHNKADVAFEQMVKGETFPSYRNAGLKKQVNRRNK